MMCNHGSGDKPSIKESSINQLSINKGLALDNDPLAMQSTGVNQ
jgi:hypothetical protein